MTLGTDSWIPNESTKEIDKIFNQIVTVKTTLNYDNCYKMNEKSI
jgi:hypothetical protein